MGSISAVIFDLDGTLVRYHGVEFESSWGALAAAAGVQAASQALFEEYFPRRDAYDDWVRADAALLKGIPFAQVAEKLLPAPYARGVREAVESLRGRYRLGILSSGVGFVADWVKNDLDLDFARANHIEIVDGQFTGRGETHVSLWSKGEALRELCSTEGLRASEVCFVGDHVNDIPVLEAAGLAIAANPKDPTLARICDHVISDFSDLPNLVAAYVAGSTPNVTAN